MGLPNNPKKVNLRGCLPQKLTSMGFFCLEFFPRRLQSGNSNSRNCLLPIQKVISNDYVEGFVLNDFLNVKRKKET